MIGDVLNRRQLVVVRKNRRAAFASQTFDLSGPLGGVASTPLYPPGGPS